MRLICGEDGLQRAADDLQFFVSAIAGKRLRIEFIDGPPCADMEKQKIMLPVQWDHVETIIEMHAAMRTTAMHEAGHCMFSGDMARECFGWGNKPWQVGQKARFTLLVNAIEDVRIEHLLTIMFPQSRQMFIEEFKRDTRLLLPEDMLATVRDPIAATRYILENKADPRFRMENELEALVLRLEQKAMELDIWNGPFPRVMGLAKEFHAEFEKYREKHGLVEDMENLERLRIGSWEGGGDHPEYDVGDVERLRAELRWMGAEKKAPLLGDHKMERELPIEVNSTEFEALPRIDAFTDKIPEVKEWTRDDPEIKRQELSAIDAALAKEQGEWLGGELTRALRIEADAVKRRTAGIIDVREVRRQVRKGKGRLLTNRVFTKYRANLRHDHVVCVLIDYSGSMLEMRKLEWAKQAAVLFAHALEALDVNYSIRAFSARDRALRINDIVLKEFGATEGFDTEMIEKSYSPRTKTAYEGQNRDGDSIRLVIEKMSKFHGKKLLIVLSDGVPDHGGTSYVGKLAEEDTRLAVAQAEAAGIKVIGVAVDEVAEQFITRAYPEHISCYSGRLQSLPNEILNAYIGAMYGAAW